MREQDFEALVDRITDAVHRRLSLRPAGPGELRAVMEAGAQRISAPPGMGDLEHAIARIIDHTALKPETTQAQIELLCAEAAKYGFVSVCINPFWIPLAKRLLSGHSVKVCTVVGFPLGSMTSAVKAFETREAIAAGADEIDMVINVGALKSGYVDVVEDDIRAVREACRGHILKVILETCLLDDEQKVQACLASKRAGADFVKTSTGFAGGGATAGDIALMRRVVGEGMGVKASGGVRSKKGAALLMAAGASRIGASASVKIVQELPGLSSGGADDGY